MEEEKWQQVVTITCRMDYLNSMGNDLGYCLAVEKLLGVEAPPRAQVLRVLLTELNRIASHLVWWGTHVMDMGAMTGFFYAFTERETILDLFECATGARLHQSYFRVGGCPFGCSGRISRSSRPTLSMSFRSLSLRPGSSSPGIAFSSDGPGESADISRKTPSSGLCRVPRFAAAESTGTSARSEPYSGYETYDFNVPGLSRWRRLVALSGAHGRDLRRALKICLPGTRQAEGAGSDCRGSSEAQAAGSRPDEESTSTS